MRSCTDNRYFTFGTIFCHSKVTLQRYVKGSPSYVISNCLEMFQTNDNFDLKKDTLEAGYVDARSSSVLVVMCDYRMA